ncbi:hypothetical protein GEMRC1_000687 [Eukaryota sp. GEM-RC1]
MSPDVVRSVYLHHFSSFSNSPMSPSDLSLLQSLVPPPGSPPQVLDWSLISQQYNLQTSQSFPISPSRSTSSLFSHYMKKIVAPSYSFNYPLALSYLEHNPNALRAACAVGRIPEASIKTLQERYLRKVRKAIRVGGWTLTDDLKLILAMGMYKNYHQKDHCLRVMMCSQAVHVKTPVYRLVAQHFTGKDKGAIVNRTRQLKGRRKA